MSTSGNVFVLHGIITHMLNQGKQLYCIVNPIYKDNILVVERDKIYMYIL